MNLIGQTLQNRYKIIRQIGEGGMGRVYYAEDARLNQIVAIKETLISRNGISSDQIASLIRSFQREAHLLAGQIKHSSIPRVIDYFQAGENWYIVMEYVDGDSLEQQRQKINQPFSISEVLNWTTQLLEVLELLHNQNPPIIHRDIKPDNIKVKNGTLYLLDFGIAKQLDDSKSTGTAYATPAFSSPEQIENINVNAVSDIYSVGATVYCLLTNREPTGAFERSLALAVGKSDPLPHIKNIRPDLSDNLADLIMSAMSVNPAQRPPNARAMRVKLNDFASTGNEKTIPYSGRQTAEKKENFSGHAAYQSTPTEVLQTSPETPPPTIQVSSAKRSKLPAILIAAAFILVGVIGVVGFAAYQIGTRFLPNYRAGIFTNTRQKSANLTEQAMENLYRNDYEQTKRLSRQAIETDATNPLAHAVYGDAFWDTETGEDVGSTNSETQISKAKIIEIFKDKQPTTAEDYAARAWAFAVERKWNQAQEDIEKTTALKSDWAWALQLKGFILSRETIFCESEKPPVESKIGIDLYKKVIALKPSFAAPYNNLALIYKCGGQEKEALDYSTQAIDAWQSAKTYTVRGFFFINPLPEKDREQLLEKARKDFLKAVELDADYSDAHRGLAAVYNNQARYDDCLDETKLSLKNKEAAESYFLWGNCRLSLAVQNQDEDGMREAQEKNDKAIELSQYSENSSRNRSLAKYHAAKASIHFAKAAYAFTAKYAKTRSAADKEEVKTELENAQNSIDEAIRLNQDKAVEPEYKKIKDGITKILRMIK